jgi:hypothetical protein
MITRELIGTAQVPDGEELRLFRHGGDFMIVLGGNELMSTRMRGPKRRWPSCPVRASPVRRGRAC